MWMALLWSLLHFFQVGFAYVSDCQTNASGFLKCCLQGLFQDRARGYQPPPLSPAWQKAKPAVWNTLGFGARELDQVLETWAGRKEDIDLASWCSAGEQQAMEGGSGTVPSPVAALLCLHGSVRLWWFTYFLLLLWRRPKLLTWESGPL